MVDIAENAKSSPSAEDAFDEFLRLLGAADLPPMTTPFDPGYAPQDLESHLRQSCKFMNGIKLSMACWLIADFEMTCYKIATAKKYGVLAVAGGGMFEIACAHGQVEPYLDLCATVGFDCIEVSQGFLPSELNANRVVEQARQRNIDVQYELGNKLTGKIVPAEMGRLIVDGNTWLDAGACKLIVEARENAHNVGLFDEKGLLNISFANQFVEAWGLDLVCFEAPTKRSQFALLDHFGNTVHISNVRLEELLRVEIYRRGLHSEAYRNPKLRPQPLSGPDATC